MISRRLRSASGREAIISVTRRITGAIVHFGESAPSAGARMRPCLAALAMLANITNCASGDASLITGRFSGHVVTANDLPVSGAYVVAQWLVNYSSLGVGGPVCKRTVSVVTNEAGTFEIPAWSGTFKKGDHTQLNGLIVSFVSYKPGYQAAAGSPTVGKSASAFSGGIQIPGTAVLVRMAPFSGGDVERAKYLDGLVNRITCDEDVAGGRAAYDAVYQEASRLPKSVLGEPKPGFVNLLGKIEVLLGIGATQPTGPRK